MTPTLDNPLAVAQRWDSEGKGVALATVIRTWGASPRAAGSQMAIDGDGDFTGSVSGGCVEAEVVLAAAEAMAADRTRMLEFGVDHDAAWAAGLTCGGRLQVLVQPVTDTGAGVTRENLQTLVDAVASARPIALATALDDYETRCIDFRTGAGASPQLWAAAGAYAGSDRSATVQADDRDWFIHNLNPPPTLAVMGAVHIARPLTRLAVTAGLRVAVIDPRRAFAESVNLAGVAVHTAWPEEVLPALDIDAGVALATLTHEPRLDDPALAWALREQIFYIGALGSRKTHAARLERLREQGFDDTTLARIRGPIGINIGAATPAEIATSIVAEVIAARRGALT